MARCAAGPNPADIGHRDTTCPAREVTHIRASRFDVRPPPAVHTLSRRMSNAMASVDDFDEAGVTIRTARDGQGTPAPIEQTVHAILATVAAHSEDSRDDPPRSASKIADS